MPDFHITRIVDRPREIVFALVADVERYPDFIPGFADAYIRRTGEHSLDVLQRVGIRGLSLSFRSKAELDPPNRILIRSRDWPFKRLDQEWTLEEMGAGTTRVTFSTTYILASRWLERRLGGLFSALVRRTVEAFERRLAQVPPQNTG